MKLTKEQLTSIFLNADLKNMINDYINEWNGPIPRPSYIMNKDMLYDSVCRYFMNWQEEIIKEIKTLINIDLTDWQDTDKYECQDFVNVLQDMLSCFNNGNNMKF